MKFATQHYDRSPVIEELYSWAERHALAARYSVNGKKQAWATAEELVIVPPGRSRLRTAAAGCRN